MTQAMQDVRPSPIAGQWYPGSPNLLTEAVDRMLADAPAADVPGRIVALVAPHAGYRYSGAVAARAFKLVEGMEIGRVVVISPMHHPMRGAFLTTGHDAYHTPLGVIPVDGDALAALGAHVELTPVREDPEHALEIELPFLQRALAGPFSLTPLMLRDQTWPAVRRLGEALADVLTGGPRALIVASSDLSHFYTEGQAHRLDQTMLDHVAAFDPEGVIRAEQEGAGFACGRGAIAAALIAAQELGADAAQIVGYATSADAGGGSSRVVGYGAAVVYESK